MDSVSDAAELGKMIRRCRIAAGLTQESAAALSGVSTPFMIAVERGKPTSQVGKVFQVCTALGLRLLAEPPVGIETVGAEKRKPRRVLP